MVDLLEHIQLEVPCSECADTYRISAELVRESQRLLAEGCSSAWVEECVPTHHAGLLPPAALTRIAAAMASLEREALRHGARAVVVDRPARPAHRGQRPDSRARETRELQEAIARWENEGGA